MTTRALVLVLHVLGVRFGGLCGSVGLRAKD